MPRKRAGRRITPCSVLLFGTILLLTLLTALPIAVAEKNTAVVQALLMIMTLVVAVTAFVALVVWLAQSVRPRRNGHPEKMPATKKRLHSREIDRFVRLCERDEKNPQAELFVAELLAHDLLPDPFNPLHPKLRKRGKA